MNWDYWDFRGDYWDLVLVVGVVLAAWPPGVLTLALSRRAGEGTVVVGGGVAVKFGRLSCGF